MRHTFRNTLENYLWDYHYSIRKYGKSCFEKVDYANPLSNRLLEANGLELKAIAGVVRLTGLPCP